MSRSLVTDRRALLGSSLGLAAYAAGLDGAAAAPDLLRLQARLVGDLTGAVRYGWYEGVVSARLPVAGARRICGVAGITCTRLSAIAGGYRRNMREAGYYYDLATGRPLDVMENPLTGEAVRAAHPVSALNGLLDADVDFHVKVRGDQLRVTRYAETSMPNVLDPAVWVRESTGPSVHIADLTICDIARDDAENGSLPVALYRASWTRITPWLPWLFMGQAEGQIVSQGIAAGVGRLEHIPVGIRRRTERHHPWFFDIAASGDETSFSFLDHYARTHRPAPPNSRV